MSTIGAEIAAFLPEARAEAESRMTATCRITRQSDEPPVRDEEHDISVTAPPVVIYEGKCRFRSELPNSAAMQNGQAMVAMQLAHFVIPLDAPVARKGDKVECLTSDVPAQVGTLRTIRAVHVGDQTTCQRYQFEEVR